MKKRVIKLIVKVFVFICIPRTNVLGGGGGYYGLVVITPRLLPPLPLRFHRSHDNFKNPYRISSIFLAPLCQLQRSFSNADLFVVCVVGVSFKGGGGDPKNNLVESL